MQGDAEPTDRPTDTKCLPATTSSLIVPPRLWNVGKGAGEDNNAMEPKPMLFHLDLKRWVTVQFVWTNTLRKSKKEFSWDFYPTPVLSGGAKVLRSLTFLNRPVQDPYSTVMIWHH
eukprot:scaffold8227_cov115-Cylindrotheca_fusiformis.AAC.1